MGVDFAGTYTRIVPQQLIEYAFGDRSAQVTFANDAGGVRVVVGFEAEGKIGTVTQAKKVLVYSSRLLPLLYPCDESSEIFREVD